MAIRPFHFASLRGNRLARIALLWLALVMGLAQTLAIQHGYSHSPGESTTQAGGKHPGGLAHCNSCIAAATLGGAAPPAGLPLLAVATQQAPHIFTATAPRPAPQQRPYANRAPPSSAS